MFRMMSKGITMAVCFLFFLSPAYAQWEPDRRLTYDASASETRYNVWCVASLGNSVHVVWYDSRDGNQEIYYKRSTDNGVSWGADTRLTHDSSSSWVPSVSVSGNTVHVVWEDHRDGNYEIYYKRSTDNGVNWGADTRLTNDPSYSESPSAPVSGDTVHVVWEDARDGTPEIYYKRSTDNGVSWGADTRLSNAPVPISDYYPSASVSGNNVYVVWNENRYGSVYIRYTRSTDGGLSWRADTTLEDTILPRLSQSPSVGVSGNKIHVVWYDYPGGVYQIFYRRSTDNGLTWRAETQLTSASFPGCFWPSVSVSGNNVHLVWDDFRDGGAGHGQIYYLGSTDNGLSWGAETRLTYDSIQAVSPSVSASGPMVHVVWEDQRDGNDEIYYKRNPTGNVGMEEGRAHPALGAQEAGYRARPNPFVSFVTVPGHERERFALYDISGRKVGTFRGDRIGEGLKAGVYFLKPEDRSAKPLRIVKVR